MHSFQPQARTPVRQSNSTQRSAGASSLLGFNTPGTGRRGLLRQSHRSASRERPATVDRGGGGDSAYTSPRLHGGPCTFGSTDGAMSAPRKPTNAMVAQIPVGAMSVGRHFVGSHNTGQSGLGGFTKSSEARREGAEPSKKESLKNVVRYLTNHNYPSPVTAKSLSSPTRAAYLDILMFLIARVDPLVPSTFTKVEEDVPRFFKDMGYPERINKTSMIAPGAPNTWPQHVAAMSWLCDILLYEEEVFPSLCECWTGPGTPSGTPNGRTGSEIVEGTDFSNGQGGHWEGVTRAIADAYRVYMLTPADEATSVKEEAANDELIEGLIEAKKAQFERAQRKKQSELDNIKNQIIDLERQTKTYDDLSESIKDARVQLTELETSMSRVQHELKQKISLVEQKTQAVEALNVDINVSTSRCDELENTISRQGINRVEVRQIDSDLKVKKKRLLSLRSERTSKEKEVYELQVQIREKIDALGGLHTKAAVEHSSLSATVKHYPDHPSTSHSSTSLNAASQRSSVASSSPELRGIRPLEMDLSMITAHLTSIEDTKEAREERRFTVDDVFKVKWKQHKEQLTRCINKEQSAQFQLEREVASVSESCAVVEKDISKRANNVVELQRQVESNESEARLFESQEEESIKRVEEQVKAVSLDIASYKSNVQDKLANCQVSKGSIESEIQEKEALLERILLEARTQFFRCAKSLVELKEFTESGFAGAVKQCEAISKSLPEPPRSDQGLSDSVIE
eukprot:GHVN01066938.1.p1 GENE.GHVN01066938.1~~GHVN01066938.1.p1  ORF type:complete len:743 (+),score=118.01 GHVN01066938.1:5346-7574(+)